METKASKVVNRAPVVRPAVVAPAAQPAAVVQSVQRGAGPAASAPKRAAASADLPMPARPMPKSDASVAITGSASASSPIASARVAVAPRPGGGESKGPQAPATLQSPSVARFTGPANAEGAKPASEEKKGEAAVVAAAGGKSAAGSPAAGKGAASSGSPAAAGASAAASPATEEKKPATDSKSAGKKPAADAKGGKPGQGGDAAGAKDAGEIAPTSPASDPAFQAVVKKAKGVAAQQKTHAPAAAKAQEAQDAAVEPSAAILGKGQARQVEEMEQAPAPPFDAAGFKESLKKRISELTPTNLEEADEFEENDKLGGVKDEMSGKVEAEKASSQGPLEEKASEEPSTSGIEAKPVTNLPPADIGKAPAPIGAKGAVPKKRGAQEVEAPLKEESKSLDDQMAEESVTDEQLQKSNEPKFMSASNAKSDAQKHAETAPKGVRQFEKKTLTKAEAEAVAVAQREVQGMYGDRSKNLNQVEGQQKEAKGKDEAARAKVAEDIENIYSATKEKVETILNDLDAKVETAFDAGAAKAKETFEEYVEEKMDAYKDERYSGALGKLQWVEDLFMDLPDEVNRFYEDGRELYLQEMDLVLDEVIAIIGTELTAARSEIQKGKDAISTYVAQLPKDLKGVGEEAAEAVGEKFAQLEESVQNKQGELIDSLAQKYQENLDAVDERIKELKEANKGLISKAAGLIRDVIEAIKKLRKLLNQILKRIAHIIGLILADPIGFFDNLMAGLKQGFNNFVANIESHLITGLFAWLTGALGPINIKVPENLFSLKGIFNLIMQVLGLTWDYIRGKAVKLFGEPIVAAMEMGAEMFKKLREGPDALWEFVKEQFNDLKEMVLDQIKEMVITEVIKAGVKWLLSLLNPAAAFIKAAMAIYSIISFIFNRAAQIADFINSLLDAIEAIAKGAVDGAAAMVEKALAKSIPLIIGLLAALLGISGLVKKVQKVIERIRKRIDKAIMKILIKAKSLVGKALQAGLPEDPKERLRLGMQAAVGAVSRLPGNKIGKTLIVPVLGAIKARYGFETLEPYTQGKRWWLKGKINPETTADTGKEEGTTTTVSYKVGDMIKARYVDGMWVAEIMKKTEESITYRFADPRKGMKTVSLTDFDKAVSDGNVVAYIADRRGTFMGKNPDRNGPVGQAIKDRYDSKGLYRPKGQWPTEQVKFPEKKSGKWVNVDDCDLSHEPVDAVTFWNTEGYKHGPRSPEVRAFMTNPNNYYFEPATLNRSRASRDGETYREPYKE